MIACENRLMRYAAADSLGKIGGPAAEAALRERLELKPNARVRKRIRVALKELESN